MVKKIGLFFAVVLLFSGCYSFYTHPEVRTTNNNTNALRLDGYYYTIEERPEAKYVTIMVLYQNGSIYGFYSNRFDLGETCSLKVVDDSMLDYSRHVGLSSQSSWAGYLIENNLITIKRIWGRFGETLYTYKGLIINDTTFIINQKNVEGSAQSSENGTKEEKNTYHFRSYSPKPDSTNKYIIIDEQIIQK